MTEYAAFVTGWIFLFLLKFSAGLSFAFSRKRARHGRKKIFVNVDVLSSEGITSEHVIPAIHHQCPLAKVLMHTGCGVYQNSPRFGGCQSGLRNQHKTDPSVSRHTRTVVTWPRSLAALRYPDSKWTSKNCWSNYALNARRSKRRSSASSAWPPGKENAAAGRHPGLSPRKAILALRGEGGLRAARTHRDIKDTVPGTGVASIRSSRFRHAPAAEPGAHLTFALKYEGVDLAVLKRLFSSVN